MVHEYKITGMTCSSCEAKVKSALLQVNHIQAVEVSKTNESAILKMDKHVDLSTLQNALSDKYQITTNTVNETIEQTKSWFSTYKPVLLIFIYIAVITLLIQASNATFNPTQWMRHFMAGFFLIFSFFKMLNLKGFAESYVMYDVIAKKFSIWAYAYAFVELALGIAFLTNLNPLITNSITVVVMSVSIIGVLQTVLNKKTIQCACLGAVFNLPMSTVTIIEDGIMILMGLAMLYLQLT
ncbi:MAG: heavy metal transporter [Crocinitomicaceae bacterium]|nr:heavy metal transporter [Crocinitomicaceae bacterium]|tara:strand:- start:1247 stop:1963 length:717 start_codon:yes stop_codon:yes gene_type:complete